MLNTYHDATNWVSEPWKNIIILIRTFCAFFVYTFYAFLYSLVLGALGLNNVHLIQLKLWSPWIFPREFIVCFSEHWILTGKFIEVIFLSKCHHSGLEFQTLVITFIRYCYWHWLLLKLFHLTFDITRVSSIYICVGKPCQIVRFLVS